MGKRVRKKMTGLLIILGGLFIVVASTLAYYIIVNKAPIIQGKVAYHINYTDNQKLDIYHPTRTVYDKSPVIIYIHGGAWVAGTKGAINFNRFNLAINDLRKSGYTIVCPNYTLARSGKSPFPDCISDAFKAVKWVEDNADKYNLDLSNVGLLGESAGSHIAMMKTFAPADTFETIGSEIKFRYLINIYGPNDLEALYRAPLLDSIYQVIERLPAGIQNQLDLAKIIFGFDPNEDSVKTEEFIRKYSPVTYIDASMPPMLLIHGDRDRVVPVEQSIQLSTRLKDLGVRHQLHVLEGVDHAFRGATQEQRQNIQHWVIQFVKENYSPLK
ncbi:MAG: alpha/beta hydrolase [Marinoscillum sp.]